MHRLPGRRADHADPGACHRTARRQLHVPGSAHDGGFPGISAWGDCDQFPGHIPDLHRQALPAPSTQVSFLQTRSSSGYLGTKPAPRADGDSACEEATFIITFVLVSNLLLISRQTGFAMDQQLGASAKQAIHLPNLHREIVDQFEVFKNRMMESPHVAHVTGSMEEPTGQTMDANTFEVDGIDE